MRPVALHDQYAAYNTGEYFLLRKLNSYNAIIFKIILTEITAFLHKIKRKKPLLRNY